MTKVELIKTVRSRLSYTNRCVTDIYESIFNQIILAVAKGDFVSTPLGRLTRVGRVERKARNPRTGEAVTIPERYVVKFKASKAFKEAVK